MTTPDMTLIAETLLTKADYRPLTIIESPFAGDSPVTISRHVRYARLAMADSISRGEAPFASHLLYTQDNILNDLIPEEREIGITCGYAWMSAADKVAIYTDFGHSTRMRLAVERLQTSQPQRNFCSLKSVCTLAVSSLREERSWKLYRKVTVRCFRAGLVEISIISLTTKVQQKCLQTIEMLI